MSSPKDLFSKQAGLYARFRPQYPRDLFEFLASLCPKKDLVWDCATGNGQAAGSLASFFDHVIATDLSEKQLVQAESNPKIQYCIGSAEKSGLASGVADLITVAQAFHWFQFSEFYSEAQRVGKPGAILAVWTYNLPQHSAKVDQVLLNFYGDTLGPYWDPERKLVEQSYSTIIVPFAELEVPGFSMKTNWSLDQLLGYLDTWSATQKWKAEDSRRRIEDLRADFASVWGQQEVLEFHWPLSLRVFRLPN